MKASLWEKEIFSQTSNEELMNIVYYHNCKLFGLRAGEKHRACPLCRTVLFFFGETDDAWFFLHEIYWEIQQNIPRRSVSSQTESQ